MLQRDHYRASMSSTIYASQCPLTYDIALEWLATVSKGFPRVFLTILLWHCMLLIL